MVAAMPAAIRQAAEEGLDGVEGWYRMRYSAPSDSRGTREGEVGDGGLWWEWRSERGGLLLPHPHDPSRTQCLAIARLDCV
jgi:hypothetical protein